MYCLRQFVDLRTVCLTDQATEAYVVAEVRELERQALPRQELLALC